MWAEREAYKAYVETQRRRKAKRVQTTIFL